MKDSERLTVVAEITENTALTTPYAVINALSTVVACYGMFENSPAVVIEAMLIATLLGPILAIALALVNGDLPLLGRAFVAELVGALVVVAVALLIGLIHRDIPLTNEILARTRPNILDLMIALAGGAAGAYSTILPSLSEVTGDSLYQRKRGTIGARRIADFRIGHRQRDLDRRRRELYREPGSVTAGRAHFVTRQSAD